MSYTVISGPATVSWDILTVTGAGLVDVEADQGGNATYAAAPSVDESFTVNPAQLTITANPATKVYSAALPTLTVTYTGLVNGDTPATFSSAPNTPTAITTTATASSHVSGNPYTITASGAVDSDYSISYVVGSLTVTAAPLTITANNQTKVYGAALPTLTASYSGFVNGDTSASLTTQPTLTTTATASSHVAGSPYTITASGAVDSDYSISYVVGSLTVTAAPLTITANNQTKVYGAALPTLTASYSGFVNGDTANVVSGAPKLTTKATTKSGVGTYSIAIAAGKLSAANYDFPNLVNGTLTVTVKGVKASAIGVAVAQAPDSEASPSPFDRTRWLGQNAPGTWAYDLLEALLWWSYAPPQPPTPTQAREHNGVAGAECPRDATEASSVSQALRTTGGWGSMPQGQEPRTALLWCRCAPPQPPLFRGRKASIQERGSSGSVQSSRSPSRQALWPELSPP